MTDIIFHNIIDKIETSSNNINTYFSNQDLYNTNIYDIIYKIPKYNLIIYIFIVFLLYSFINRLNIRLNEILSFIICTLLIYFLIKKDYTQFIEYTQVKKNQLNFLHKLMFNSKNIDYEKQDNKIIKPIGTTEKSYLYLNPVIVELFYNLRNYSQHNISSYINSLIHCNNVIALDYQSKLGLVDVYLNYEVAVEESNKALNEYNSIIYSLPSAKVSYKKFNDSIKVLHGLLNKHISNMGTLFKNKNKITDITISSMPDNFYDNEHNVKSNDMNTRDYKSVYNMY
jgi:hypothetical protein